MIFIKTDRHLERVTVHLLPNLKKRLPRLNFLTGRTEIILLRKKGDKWLINGKLEARKSEHSLY